MTSRFSLPLTPRLTSLPFTMVYQRLTGKAL